MNGQCLTSEEGREHRHGKQIRLHVKHLAVSPPELLTCGGAAPDLTGESVKDNISLATSLDCVFSLFLLTRQHSGTHV